MVKFKAEVKLFHSVNVEVEANEKFDAYHKVKEQVAFMGYDTDNIVEITL
jgi:hypothetical protein